MISCRCSCRTINTRVARRRTVIIAEKKLVCLRALADKKYRINSAHFLPDPPTFSTCWSFVLLVFSSLSALVTCFPFSVPQSFAFFALSDFYYEVQKTRAFFLPRSRYRQELEQPPLMKGSEGNRIQYAATSQAYPYKVRILP